MLEIIDLYFANIGDWFIFHCIFFIIGCFLFVPFCILSEIIKKIAPKDRKCNVEKRADRIFRLSIICMLIWWIAALPLLITVAIGFMILFLISDLIVRLFKYLSTPISDFWDRLTDNADSKWVDIIFGKKCDEDC